MALLDRLGSFDVVLDVGGNVGVFAERCSIVWPDAEIYSFEPVYEAYVQNRDRAEGRWRAINGALGADHRTVSMNVCTSFSEVSTLKRPGSLRRERLGVVDDYEKRTVDVVPLDSFGTLEGRVFVKLDVEGYELEVIAGGPNTFAGADAVLCEVNQEPDIFYGAPTAQEINAALAAHGLEFSGVVGVQLDPRGQVIQFDGLWCR